MEDKNSELKMVTLLSPTSISTYLKDQSQWYKDKILKIPKRSIYLTGGSALHQFVEDFFMFAPKRGEKLITFKERRFNELMGTLWDYKDQNGELFSTLIDEFGEELHYTRTHITMWMTCYFDRWLYRASMTEEKKGTTKAWKMHSPTKSEMYLTHDGLRIHGYVDAWKKDFWHTSSNTLQNVVIDYKTSQQNEDVVYTDYFLQMKIYAVMLRGMGNNVHRVMIDFLKTGDRESERVTDEELDRIEEMIRDVWHEIEEKGLDQSKYLDWKETKKHSYKWNQTL